MALKLNIESNLSQSARDAEQFNKALNKAADAVERLGTTGQRASKDMSDLGFKNAASDGKKLKDLVSQLRSELRKVEAANKKIGSGNEGLNQLAKDAAELNDAVNKVAQSQRRLKPPKDYSEQLRKASQAAKDVNNALSKDSAPKFGGAKRQIKELSKSLKELEAAETRRNSAEMVSRQQLNQLDQYAKKVKIAADASKPTAKKAVLGVSKADVKKSEIDHARLLKQQSAVAKSSKRTASSIDPMLVSLQTKQTKVAKSFDDMSRSSNRFNSSGVSKLEQSIGKAQAAGKTANFDKFGKNVTANMAKAADASKKLSALETGLNRTKSVAETASAGFSGMFAAVAQTALIAGTTAGLFKLSDTLASITGHLKAVTGSMNDFVAANSEVNRIAMVTGASLKDVASLQGRLSIASRSLGATQKQVGQVTETIMKAMTVSGAAKSEASSVALQLGQAIASGKFQGDELRSVLENGTVLADALAKSMGKTVGELRAMGAEGSLTARMVFEALLKSSKDVNAQFSKMPRTWEMGFQRLGNAALIVSGILAKRLGVDTWSEAFNKGIDRLGDFSGKLELLLTKASHRLFMFKMDASEYLVIPFMEAMEHAKGFGAQLTAALGRISSFKIGDMGIDKLSGRFSESVKAIQETAKFLTSKPLDQIKDFANRAIKAIDGLWLKLSESKPLTAIENAFKSLSDYVGSIFKSTPKADASVQKSKGPLVHTGFFSDDKADDTPEPMVGKLIKGLAIAIGALALFSKGLQSYTSILKLSAIAGVAALAAKIVDSFKGFSDVNDSLGSMFRRKKPDAEKEGGTKPTAWFGNDNEEKRNKGFDFGDISKPLLYLAAVVAFLSTDVWKAGLAMSAIAVTGMSVAKIFDDIFDLRNKKRTPLFGGSSDNAGKPMASPTSYYSDMKDNIGEHSFLAKTVAALAITFAWLNTRTRRYVNALGLAILFFKAFTPMLSSLLPKGNLLGKLFDSENSDASAKPTAYHGKGGKVKLYNDAGEVMEVDREEAVANLRRNQGLAPNNSSAGEKTSVVATVLTAIRDYLSHIFSVISRMHLFGGGKSGGNSGGYVSTSFVSPFTLPGEKTIGDRIRGAWQAIKDWLSAFWIRTFSGAFATISGVLFTKLSGGSGLAAFGVAVAGAIITAMSAGGSNLGITSALTVAALTAFSSSPLVNVLGSVFTKAWAGSMSIANPAGGLARVVASGVGAGFKLAGSLLNKQVGDSIFGDGFISAVGSFAKLGMMLPAFRKTVMDFSKSVLTLGSNLGSSMGRNFAESAGLGAALAVSRKNLADFTDKHGSSRSITAARLTSVEGQLTSQGRNLVDMTNTGAYQRLYRAHMADDGSSMGARFERIAAQRAIPRQDRTAFDALASARAASDGLAAKFTALEGQVTADTAALTAHRTALRENREALFNKISGAAGQLGGVIGGVAGFQAGNKTADKFNADDSTRAYIVPVMTVVGQLLGSALSAGITRLFIRFAPMLATAVLPLLSGAFGAVAPMLVTAATPVLAALASVSWPLLGIAAAIAVAYTAFKFLEKDEKPKAVWSQFGDNISAGVKGLFASMAGNITSTWKSMTSGITSLVSGAFDNLKKGVTGIIDKFALLTKVIGILRSVIEYIGKAYDLLKNGFKTVTGNSEDKSSAGVSMSTLASFTSPSALAGGIAKAVLHPFDTYHSVMGAATNVVDRLNVSMGGTKYVPKPPEPQKATIDAGISTPYKESGDDMPNAATPKLVPYDPQKFSKAQQFFGPKKPEADRSQYVASSLRNNGLSPLQASAVAGNLFAESGMKPYAVNPTSGASGIAQWLGPRLERLLARTGASDISGTTIDQQISFLMDELQSTEAATKQAMDSIEKQMTEAGAKKEDIAKALADVFGSTFERRRFPGMSPAAAQGAANAEATARDKAVEFTNADVGSSWTSKFAFILEPLRLFGKASEKLEKSAEKLDLSVLDKYTAQGTQGDLMSSFSPAVLTGIVNQRIAGSVQDPKYADYNTPFSSLEDVLKDNTGERIVELLQEELDLTQRQMAFARGSSQYTQIGVRLDKIPDQIKGLATERAIKRRPAEDKLPLATLYDTGDISFAKEAGGSFMKNVSEGFRTGLSDELKKKKDRKPMAKAIADALSEGMIDSFVSGLTHQLFNNTKLGSTLGAVGSGASLLGVMPGRHGDTTKSWVPDLKDQKSGGFSPLGFISGLFGGDDTAAATPYTKAADGSMMVTIANNPFGTSNAFGGMPSLAFADSSTGKAVSNSLTNSVLGGSIADNGKQGTDTGFNLGYNFKAVDASAPVPSASPTGSDTGGDGGISGWFTSIITSMKTSSIGQAVSDMFSGVFGDSGVFSKVSTSIGDMFSGIFGDGSGTGGKGAGISAKMAAGIGGLLTGAFTALSSKGGHGQKTAGYLMMAMSAMQLMMLADGGPVAGPGTSTSDSVPAMLSNGEFVVNASSASQHRGLLQAINSGQSFHHLAAGGFAGTPSGIRTAANASTKASARSVVNLTITGDISRQTRREIMDMMPDIASGVNSNNREQNYKARS